MTTRVDWVCVFARGSPLSQAISFFFLIKEEKVKKGFLAILAVLLFASVAMANETRVGTMGGNDVLLWDEENIFWCPALATGYANEFLAELDQYPAPGGYSDAHLGVFLTNDEMASMGVLGLVVNRTTAAVPSNGSSFEFLAPIPSFDLIYAKNMGGLGIGGMLSLARDSRSREMGVGDTSDISTMVIGFTPGVTFAVGEKGTVDIGFGFQMTSFSSEDKTTDPVTTWESDGAQTLGARLRAMLPMGEYVYFIPHVGFEMSSLNWKQDTVNVTVNDGTMFGGGFGLNIMPFEETTVIVGFEVGISSQDNSSANTAPFADSINSMSTMTPTLVFGAESRFNSWMTGRIGARKTFFASSSWEGYAGDKSTSATDSFLMALGLGMVFGDFTLDAMLDENFLFEGPNFIGGSNTTAPSAKLTATYNFSGM